MKLHWFKCLKLKVLQQLQDLNVQQGQTNMRTLSTSRDQLCHIVRLRTFITSQRKDSDSLHMMSR